MNLDVEFAEYRLAEQTRRASGSIGTVAEQAELRRWLRLESNRTQAAVEAFNDLLKGH